MENLPKIHLALLDEEIVIHEQDIPRQVEAQLHLRKQILTNGRIVSGHFRIHTD